MLEKAKNRKIYHNYICGYLGAGEVNIENGKSLKYDAQKVNTIIRRSFYLD